MAAALAQKLCEAVENEDAKEVENLLNCGADPNLVLPDGIAAIHLASGKESESALRCLTIILQQGGDPNVRSIEELTPVHVAASWGCCKALTFLLRKGGDPNSQDQDGNTAIDLALMEKNRRCVVALQEYGERNERLKTFPDQICDYYKDNPSEPDEIPEMSNITLLLESAYEESPCSSTKISPFIFATKKGTTGKGADNAALASQIELASFDLKGKSRKSELAVLESSDFKLNDPMTNGTSDIWADYSESKCSISTLQNGPCMKDCSRIYPDIGVGKYSAKIDNMAHVVLNSEKSNGSGNQEKDIRIPSLNSTSQANLVVNRNGKKYSNLLLNHSSKLTESQFILEGLDVTSPDHAYTYIRGHVDIDLEETLVLPKTDDLTEAEALVGQEISSSSKYTSCFSDSFATLIENSACEKAAFDSSVSCKSLLDSNSNQVCTQNSGIEDKTNVNFCSGLNVNDSLPGAVNTLPERAKEMDNEETTSNNNQMLNGKHLVLSSKNMLSDGHESDTVRITETLCTSQSPTIPIDETNAFEGCSQDLRSRLRNLLLSAKGCGLILEQGNYSLPGRLEPRSETSCSSTVPVIGETNPPIGPNLKDISLTCLNTSEDTLIVDSCNHESKELNAELYDIKKMLLATKVAQPVSTMRSEEKSPCFFTERTKSRLQSSKYRHRNSSLFDESLEMPQRGWRLRSPNRKSGSPVLSAEARKCFSRTGLLCCSEPSLETGVAQNNTCLVQTSKDPRGNISDSETTVSISNFLTDDLSSEMDVQSTLQLKKTTRDPYIVSRISESVWLTEDGETESSGEDYHKLSVSSGKQANNLEEALSSASQTGSFLHSTLIEDEAGNSAKVLRYSFSRLSCVPKEETVIKPTTLSDSVIEEAHLSPGGRPVNATRFEPVEYLYMDNEKGHALVERHLPCLDQSSSSISDISDDTVLYDWRNYSSCKEKVKDLPACPSSRVAVELYRLSNDEIARRLRELGEDPGQVNSKTRKVCIMLLDKRLKEHAASGSRGPSFEYSPELSVALRSYDIPDCNNDEASLSREFDQPDKTRKWREGVLKSSFNYLLLDPRVTRNLPSRCHMLSLPECFRTFVRAVFYVGKGKRARPYCHLYESLTHYKGSNKQLCSKVQHIVDIWRSGQGVLSLHCFQNTIPVEAYTREACMVDAIGLKMLTNKKKGVYYGQAQNWTPTRQRRLGVHMLHRAMQIFLAEGERQLRPPDIRSGS